MKVSQRPISSRARTHKPVLLFPSLWVEEPPARSCSGGPGWGQRWWLLTALLEVVQKVTVYILAPGCSWREIQQVAVQRIRGLSPGAQEVPPLCWAK